MLYNITCFRIFYNLLCYVIYDYLMTDVISFLHFVIYIIIIYDIRLKNSRLILFLFLFLSYYLSFSYLSIFDPSLFFLYLVNIILQLSLLWFNDLRVDQRKVSCIKVNTRELNRELCTELFTLYTKLWWSVLLLL